MTLTLVGERHSRGKFGLNPHSCGQVSGLDARRRTLARLVSIRIHAGSVSGLCRHGRECALEVSIRIHAGSVSGQELHNLYIADPSLNPHSRGQCVRTDLLEYPDFLGKKQPVSNGDGEFPFGRRVFARVLRVILAKIIIMAEGYHFSTGEWAVLGVLGLPVWGIMAAGRRNVTSGSHRGGRQFAGIWRCRPL